MQREDVNRENIYLTYMDLSPIVRKNSTERRKFMRFLYPIFIFFMVLSINLYGYNIVWIDTLDSGNDDRACDLVIHRDGNVYVTGYFYIGGNTQYLTIKYDSTGNILWADTLGGSEDDYAEAITMDNQGNIYVTGYSYTGADYDYLTVKYDSLGNIVWIDTLDNGASEYAEDIAVDERGNVYVTGYTSTGLKDYLTVKYDPSGNVIWIDTVDYASYDYGEGIAVDDRGNVYVTGTSYIGGFDFVTIKYDSSGDILWEDTLDEGGDDWSFDIFLDTAGNIYLAGCSNNGTDDDAFVVKYDTSGNILWRGRIDEGDYEYAWGLTVDGNGRAYIAGMHVVNGDGRFFTAGCTPTGSAFWTSTLGVGEAYGVGVYGVQNLYVAGYLYNTTDDWMVVRYRKTIDAGILTMVSSDTASIRSEYIPQILIKNNSHFDTLTFNAGAYIDSAGTHIYSDLKSVYALPPQESILVSFDPWTAPDSFAEYEISFILFLSDDDPTNDTLVSLLFVRDLLPPLIDSAIASDGGIPLPGIDDDDYIVLYFSKKTNMPLIDSRNIDRVLSLSGGHSWLDGFGTVEDGIWSEDGASLVINLTTFISPPTIAPGDTIYPDGKTITDVYGNACISPVILQGTFDPPQRVPEEGVYLDVPPVNHGRIFFTFYVKEGEYRICLYGVDGRVIREIKGEGEGYHKAEFHNIPPGFYFLRLQQKDTITVKKVMVLE